MTGAIYYPPADRHTQWYGLGNATVAPTKVLWHSTETAGGWPGYAGGTMAPNLTYEPWWHLWRQHFPLNGTARALANAKDGSGYQTNRKGVVQVEVSCYCDPARFGSGKGVPNLDEQAYDDMGRFAEFMRAEWGVPLHVGVASKPYPSSYGDNGVRLSGPAFAGYRGHCCHLHAPYNSHGDAGVMDLHRITTVTQGDDMFTDNDRKVFQAGIGDAQFKANAAYATSSAVLAELRQFVAETTARLDAIEAAAKDDA